MQITTTFEIQGHIIKEVIGVVTANQVLGNNIISENIAAFTDVFGGKSGQYRGKLEELIEDAICQLKEQAKRKGANAIVGFSVSTNQISSKGMSMFMVTATGTAVKLEIDRYAQFEKLHQLHVFYNEGIISEEEYKYEESRIRKAMNNVIASEAKEAAELKRIQDEEAAEKARQKEEADRIYAEKHAAELKAREEERIRYEQEHAEDIKKKAEIIDFIKAEFPKKKSEVERVAATTVANASYKEHIPNIDGLTDYDKMRYLVSINQIPAACKYYCDKYNLPAEDAKEYLLGIFKVM